MRPSERAPAGFEPLRDKEVADWLEARPRAALLFWDEGDDACMRFRPRLELVAAAADIAVGVVDVRTDALVAQALGVTSVPTTVVFHNGELVERIIGSPPEAVIRDALG